MNETNATTPFLDSSDGQFLTHLTVGMACVGSLGCLSTLTLFYCFRKTQGTFTKYVWWLVVTELVVCLNYVIMPFDNASQVEGLCHFHGFLMQWSELAEVTWNLIVNGIIFHFFYCATYKIRQLENYSKNFKRDIIIHSFVWGFATLDASVLWIVGQYKADLVWCWISDDIYRLIFWYIPLWSMWFTSIFLFVGSTFLSKKITKHTKQISTGDNLRKTLVQFKIVRVTGLYFILSFLFAWLAPTVNRFTHIATKQNAPMSIWIWHIVTGERADGYTKFFLYLWIVFIVYKSKKFDKCKKNERITEITFKSHGENNNNSENNSNHSNQSPFHSMTSMSLSQSPAVNY